jgi:LPXTG-motif cell wall-anchored protein
LPNTGAEQDSLAALLGFGVLLLLGALLIRRRT